MVKMSHLSVSLSIVLIFTLLFNVALAKTLKRDGKNSSDLCVFFRLFISPGVLDDGDGIDL